MRINKFLAQRYGSSRRKSEEFVKNGLVKVNGKVVSNLATEVNENDFIEVEGMEEQKSTQKVYLALHKPKGCVCTNSDEHGRKTVFDYIPEQFNKTRLFCVGRLDYDTEGLVLLTNDGDLCNKLTHPSKQIEKVYIASVSGEVAEEKLKALRKGVKLDDGFVTSPAKVRLLGQNGNLARISVGIIEGKNRQVKRMFESVGLAVEFLVRKSVGPIKLGGLSRGKVRELNKTELDALKRL